MLLFDEASAAEAEEPQEPHQDHEATAADGQTEAGAGEQACAYALGQLAFPPPSDGVGAPEPKRLGPGRRPCSGNESPLEAGPSQQLA